MFLTFGKARKIVAQYAGKGGLSYRSQEVHDFLVSVMQYILHIGQYGSTKKFCFHAVNGCFTAPYELEIPLEVKVDEEVGKVWNKWFEFNDSNPLVNGVAAGIALYEDPNYYPTVYDIASSGAAVGVMGTCREEDGAHIIVQGLDTMGRDVYTHHKGGQISGEYLSIKENAIQYTSTIFSKITNIVKPETNGYVQLYGIDAVRNTRNFLSEYTPLETVPSYRRFQLTQPCPNPCKITVLGRIRIKDRYADNERIFFDNIPNLVSAAQALHGINNGRIESAAAYDTALQTNIERENSYKKPATNNPIRVNPVTSGSSIRNIRSRRR